MTIAHALECIEYDRNQLADARGSDYSGVEALDTILNHACILSKEETCAVYMVLRRTSKFIVDSNIFTDFASAYDKIQYVSMEDRN